MSKTKKKSTSTYSEKLKRKKELSNINKMEKELSERADEIKLQELQLKRRELSIQRKESQLKNLEKELGQRKAQRLVSNLVKRELLKREYEMEPEKARPKVESRVTLAGNPQSIRATIEEFKTGK